MLDDRQISIRSRRQRTAEVGLDDEDAELANTSSFSGNDGCML